MDYIKSPFFWVVIFGVTAFGLYFLIPKKDYIDVPHKDGPIIAFGDSLVEGIGSTQGGFVSILSARLGTPIINAGRSGDTTETAILRLEEDVLAHDPKIVIILLGGNDGLRKHPVEDTFERLKTIIRRIHESDSAVLLVGIQPALFNQEFNKQFSKLADDEKVSFVPDILDGLIGKQKYMADPIHPNNIGYEIIADRMEPILRKMLSL